jgi:hypothetical protein
VTKLPLDVGGAVSSLQEQRGEGVPQASWLRLIVLISSWRAAVGMTRRRLRPTLSAGLARMMPSSTAALSIALMVAWMMRTVLRERLLGSEFLHVGEYAHSMT